MQAEEVLQVAQAVEEEVISLRRHLHRWPELSYREEETAHFVADRLRETGIEVREGVGGTGVVGTLTGRRSEPVVALRADMDALPVEEDPTHWVRSERPGLMHACGHDAHMAVLLGVARVLGSFREELPGRVLFLFQPAEETPPGGAEAMLRDGVFLPKPRWVFGLHNAPQMPAGVIGYRPGVLMAAANEFTLEFIGEGGHAAAPHRAVDSILVAAEFVLSLQSIVAREVDPFEPAVVSLGQIRGGEAFNIIPERVSIRGTIRSLGREGIENLGRAVERIAAAVAAAHRARYEIRFLPGYPLLVNDPTATELARRAAAEILGEDMVRPIPEASLGGEDFARYLAEVPGSFLFLGTGRPDRPNHPWHHSKFEIAEEALVSGVAALSWIAWRAMEEAGP